MTLRQEAYEKLTVLPDSGLRIILAVADELIRQNRTEDRKKSDSKRIQEKQAAVERIIQMREEAPLPSDFDWKSAREAAMREKYGRFM